MTGAVGQRVNHEGVLLRYETDARIQPALTTRAPIGWMGDLVRAERALRGLVDVLEACLLPDAAFSHLLTELCLIHKALQRRRASFGMPSLFIERESAGRS